jgi:hypothetical protein
METRTITGRCRDWQGYEYSFRFSWATDAGIEWGNLYLDNSQRPEILGFERLRSMDVAHCDSGQEFPTEIGPIEGWDQPQLKVPEAFYPTSTDSEA